MAMTFGSEKGACGIQMMMQLSLSTHLGDGASSDIHHFDGYFLSSRWQSTRLGMRWGLNTVLLKGG